VATPTKLARRSGACLRLRLSAFQGVIDLARTLVEQEETTGDQDHVPPGNRLAEELD
jgi:hypothetical protein